MSSPSPPLVTRDTPFVRPSTTTLYWRAPLSSGDSSISSYTLTCSSISFQASVAHPRNFYSLSNLDDGVTYNFTLVATNDNGNVSDEGYYYPLQTGNPPEPTQSNVYTTLTSNAAFFQWAAPLSNGNSAIDYYAMWFYPIDAQSNILSNTTSTLKYNTNGNQLSNLIYFEDTSVQYKYIVRSINSAGWSSNTLSNYSIFQFASPLSNFPSSSVFFTTYNTGTNELGLTNFQTSNLSTHTLTNSGFSYNYPFTNTSIIKQINITSTNTVSFVCSAYLRNYGDYPTFLFFRNGTTPASGMNCYQNIGRLVYHWNDNGNNTNTGIILPSSTWLHLALTISPTQAKWYVNTSSVYTLNTTHNAIDLSNCYFGQDPAVSVRTMPGMLDNIGLFSTTLTQADITNLYYRSLAI